MTRQTTAPLGVLSLSTGDRQICELARSFRESFGIDMNPPYQRGRQARRDRSARLLVSHAAQRSGRAFSHRSNFLLLQCPNRAASFVE